ncbi:hypothetical protein HJC23_004477 [Cyclotella cryptica]|uniref:IRS-type PTB domain-containing protein n=1 Tax=Cyclotella cryptica TaxID=29204 RepID=A0ABD3PSL4_9STRA|eukprot:CCRYP_011924-RA/>CCRYP_011924-RA protein AED:0.18 eAED:0.18 QI:0/-1/0/1/-1/1/1/0/431
MFDTPHEHLLAIGSLSENDYAFIRRSGGKFCFDMIRSIQPRPDSIYMEFLVNESGGIKSIPMSEWENYIRPIRPYVTWRQTSSRGKAMKVKDQGIKEIERGCGTKAQSGNPSPGQKKNQRINRSSSVDSFLYNQDSESNGRSRFVLNRGASAVDLRSLNNFSNNDVNAGSPSSSSPASCNIAPHDQIHTFVNNIRSDESCLRFSSLPSDDRLNKTSKASAHAMIHELVCNHETNHGSNDHVDTQSSTRSSLESSTYVPSFQISPGSSRLSVDEVLDYGDKSRRMSWNKGGSEQGQVSSCFTSISCSIDQAPKLWSKSEHDFSDNIFHQKSLKQERTSAGSRDVDKQHLCRSTIGTEFGASQFGVSLAKKRYPRRASAGSEFNERHLLSAFATISRPPLDTRKDYKNPKLLNSIRTRIRDHSSSLFDNELLE